MTTPQDIARPNRQLVRRSAGLAERTAGRRREAERLYEVILEGRTLREQLTYVDNAYSAIEELSSPVIESLADELGVSDLIRALPNGAGSGIESLTRAVTNDVNMLVVLQAALAYIKDVNEINAELGASLTQNLNTEAIERATKDLPQSVAAIVKDVTTRGFPAGVTAIDADREERDRFTSVPRRGSSTNSRTRESESQESSRVSSPNSGAIVRASDPSPSSIQNLALSLLTGE